MPTFDKKVVRAAIERIKEHLNLKTDIQLSEFLGLSSNTLNMWKRRGTLDLQLIYSKVPNISLDWVLNGVGESSIKQTSVLNSAVADIKHTAQRMATDPFRDVMKYVNQPVEEYGSPAEEILTSDEKYRIPIIGIKLDGERPIEVFDTITGYFHTESLASEGTVLLELYDDNYKDSGFNKGDMLLIDTKAIVKDNNYIVVLKNKKHQICKVQNSEGEKSYTDLKSGKTTIISKENYKYIVGVIKTKIRDY